MTTSPLPDVTAATFPVESYQLAPLRRSGLAAAFDLARRHVLAVVGLVVVVLVLLIAAGASVIAPYGIDEQDLNAVSQAPSGAHWFGTDQLGRDVFSRTLYGARTSALIGIASVTLATIFAAAVALVSAYAIGLVDLILQRIVDVLSALPTLILLLSVILILGDKPMQIVIAVAITFFPTSVRLIRSEALVVRNLPFIEVARSLGASPVGIMLRHILPGVLPIIIVVASVQIGGAILLESSLSFLGYGVKPPTADWGQMLSGSTQALAIYAPWLGIAPGVAIALTVFGFNVLGDGLRDVLDPRLRRSR